MKSLIQKIQGLNNVQVKIRTGQSLVAVYVKTTAHNLARLDEILQGAGVDYSFMKPFNNTIVFSYPKDAPN